MCAFAGGEDSRGVGLEEDAVFAGELRDDQVYRTIIMPDGRTWMAENLNFATDSGSWCYGNCDIYGRLYDWNTAMEVCPAGWHLPTTDEWTALEHTVGGSSIAGRKLKSQSGWQDNANGTDDFGFSALPSGMRSNDTFINLGSRGNWWSATGDADYANLRYIVSSMSMGNPSAVQTGISNTSNGFSVRCVMN